MLSLDLFISLSSLSSDDTLYLYEDAMKKKRSAPWNVSMVANICFSPPFNNFGALLRLWLYTFCFTLVSALRFLFPSPNYDFDEWNHWKLLKAKLLNLFSGYTYFSRKIALLPRGHKTKPKVNQSTQLVHLSLKTQQKYCSETFIQLQLTLQSMTVPKETFQIVKRKIIFFLHVT